MPTYQGSCHCGAVTFRLVSEISELTTCDCSLCRQKNALMTKVHESALTILSGEELLSV
ncbi:GFA family protein [Bradyrhizobium sp. UFLA05-153]